jgi:hypothetical protein
MLRRVVWYILTDVSEVLHASIIRAMIAQTIRRNIPEDSHLHFLESWYHMFFPGLIF